MIFNGQWDMPHPNWLKLENTSVGRGDELYIEHADKQGSCGGAYRTASLQAVRNEHFRKQKLTLEITKETMTLVTALTK